MHQHRARQIEQVRDLLRMAGRTVPYYRQLFRELGFDPADSRLDGLQEGPLLTRDMVRELGSALVPRARRSAYRYQTTGGTSGQPLGFRIAHDVSRGVGVHDQSTGSRGYRRGSRRVVVRDAPSGGANKAGCGSTTQRLPRCTSQAST